MKQLRRLSGLGDVVETVTTVTGVKAIAETVAKRRGKPCGCAERRDKLNRLVPFGKDTDELHADTPGTE